MIKYKKYLRYWVISLKITEVDKETKKSKKDYILPIAMAGLGFGATCLLMKTGVINYNNLLDMNSVNDVIETVQQNINNIPTSRILKSLANFPFEVIKGTINTLGIQGLMVIQKSYGLVKEVAKPIKDSEKFQNSKFHHIIKKIEKMGKVNTKKSNEGAHVLPESLKKLAKNSLSIGGMVFLIATNRIDYNAMLDFNNLPHKFAKIADYAKNIDMNKVAIGIESIKKIGDFIKTRKEEKVQNNLQGVNFKTILHKTGEKMKKSEFPTLTKLKNIDKQMQISNLEITHDNGLIAQDER